MVPAIAKAKSCHPVAPTVSSHDPVRGPLVAARPGVASGGRRHPGGESILPGHPLEVLPERNQYRVHWFASDIVTSTPGHRRSTDWVGDGT